VGKESELVKLDHLLDWIPISSYWQDGQPMLDWCYAGDQRFIRPFWQEDVEALLQHPFNMIFRHQTELDSLAQLSSTYPGIKPTGFIFHTGRCGSTLISQMLATLPRNIVISEPGILDLALKSNPRHRLFSDKQRIDILRSIINVLGRKRADEQTNYFIKFDNWAILDLPLIRKTFPDVPWLFLYREPVAIMVSNLKTVAGKSFPLVVDPAILGLEIQEVVNMPFEEYLAITTAKFCQIALSQLDEKGMLVNYKQLPDFVCSDLLAHWGLEYSQDEIETMKKVSGLNAKRPSTAYIDDTAAKEREASDLVLQMADKWITPVYRELEAKRLA
jgi:hypothetical protein